MAQRKKTGRGGSREGAGRPPVLDDPADVSLKVERRELDAAKRLAERQGVSVAELLRRALKAHLARHRRK